MQSSGERGAPPVHQFEGTFRGKKAWFKMTSVAGHLFSIDFPDELQDWDSVDPACLFDAPVEKRPTKGSVLTSLRNEGKGVDYLVLWLDCDREGEAIAFEVIDVVAPVMGGSRVLGPSGGILRAKFSAVTKDDILRAMSSLVAPNRCEANAVAARQELDLKVGVAFSRFQTVYFRGKFSGLDSRVLSYGPCQTPTLGFIVQRHVEIQHFTPEPYWTVDMEVLLTTQDAGAGTAYGQTSGNASGHALGQGRQNDAGGEGGEGGESGEHGALRVSLAWSRSRIFDPKVAGLENSRNLTRSPH